MIGFSSQTSEDDANRQSVLSFPLCKNRNIKCEIVLSFTSSGLLCETTGLLDLDTVKTVLCLLVQDLGTSEESLQFHNDNNVYLTPPRICFVVYSALDIHK